MEIKTKQNPKNKSKINRIQLTYILGSQDKNIKGTLQEFETLQTKKKKKKEKKKKKKEKKIQILSQLCLPHDRFFFSPIPTNIFKQELLEIITT